MGAVHGRGSMEDPDCGTAHVGGSLCRSTTPSSKLTRPRLSSRMVSPSRQRCQHDPVNQTCESF